MTAKPPSLETDRLLLRPLHANDAPALTGLVDDPPRWIQRARRAYAWYGCGPLAVVRKADAVLAGIAGAEPLDRSAARDPYDLALAANEYTLVLRCRFRDDARDPGLEQEACDAVIADARTRLQQTVSAR